MSGLLKRLGALWRRARTLDARARARAAEVRGELLRAAELYVEAKLDGEAQRVLLSHASTVSDPLERLMLLGRARDLSSGELRQELSRRCAAERLDLCKARIVRLGAAELDELAGELSRLGSPELAAEAHALAGNVEDQARALVEAGAIEQLEAVLDADRKRSEREVAAKERSLRAYDLESSGQRRRALALAHSKEAEGDRGLCELARQIEAKRCSGPRVVLDLAGSRRRFALGREVSLGRAGATLEIPSPAISRAHLVLSRDASGPIVRDVSRNGTRLGGALVDTVLGIREPLTLELGAEVTVRLAPDPEFCVRLELLDTVWYAPLGALHSAVGVFDLGEDGWLELDPAGAEVYLGGLRVMEPVQLCRGDRLSLGRDGPVVVEVLS